MCWRDRKIRMSFRKHKETAHSRPATPISKQQEKVLLLWPLLHFLPLTAKTVLRFTMELQPILFSSNCKMLSDPEWQEPSLQHCFYTLEQRSLQSQGKSQCDYMKRGRKELGVVHFWNSSPKIHSTLWLGKIKLHVMHYKRGSHAMEVLATTLIPEHQYLLPDVLWGSCNLSNSSLVWQRKALVLLGLNQSHYKSVFSSLNFIKFTC